MQLVQKKIKAGQTEVVTQIEPEQEAVSSAKIYDLTEMLQQSLKRGNAPQKAVGHKAGVQPKAGISKGKAIAAKATPRKTSVKQKVA